MNNKKAKKQGYKPKSRLRARLSFDDGYAERPLYSIRAFTNEKNKGMNMIELIQDNFNINSLDVKEFQQEKFNELTNDFEVLEKDIIRKKEPLKLTRDEKGNLMSPFGNKAKELKRLNEDDLNEKKV